jgi:hypothetical protein
MGTGFRTALDYNCFIGVDRIINFGQQFFIREASKSSIPSTVFFAYGAT